MAKASVGAIRLIDSDGDALDDGAGKLNVNATLVAGAEINIGNVELVNNAGDPLLVSGATTDALPDLDGQQLLGTHALLSARKDSSTTIGITALDGTHNALHVALSDGANTLGVSQQSETVVANGIGIMGEAKVVDGSVFPNSVSEGEAVRLASSRGGILYTCLTSTGGLKSAVEHDDSGQEALPAMVNVGGEYRASPTTYTDGDAAILQSDINGHLKIAGSHIDDGDFTLNESSGIAIMGFAGTQSITADDVGVLKCNTTGELNVALHAADGTAITESGGFLNVSIRSGSAITSIGQGAPAYVWATGMEYADFDGSSLPFLADIDTEGDATPYQGSKYGVQYIMPVNEDGSKSPIDQTSGQMVTTHGITGMVSGANAAISSSTAEQLDGSTSGLDVACKRVDIMADTANTGYIWVGDSGVVANGSGGGIKLGSGDFYSIDVDNLNDIWLIATVDAENATYIYFT